MVNQKEMITSPPICKGNTFLRLITERMLKYKYLHFSFYLFICLLTIIIQYGHDIFRS